MAELTRARPEAGAAKLGGTRLLVIGWMPPPFNGRSNEVAALLRAPFTEQFEIAGYDTKLRDARGGTRPDPTLLLNMVRQVRAFPKALRVSRPDAAVFCTGPGPAFWRDLLFLRLCHHARVPVAVKLIGGSITGKLRKYPAAARAAALRDLRRAKAILTETHDMVEDLRALCPGVPAHRITNFIHPEDVPEGDRDGDAEPKIVFFGNMTPSKGCEVVLDSVDAVCSRHPATFHFIGGELEKGYLDRFRERAGRLRSRDRVHIHGRMTREATHALARGCHIFAFPTRWPGEGQPGALVEAMAMGLVPVVTRWRGAGEIVAEGVDGLTLDGQDPAALAERIETLLSDRPRLRALGDAARRKAREAYGAEAALKQYREIIEEILAPC